MRALYIHRKSPRLWPGKTLVSPFWRLSQAGRLRCAGFLSHSLPFESLYLPVGGFSACYHLLLVLRSLSTFVSPSISLRHKPSGPSLWVRPLVWGVGLCDASVDALRPRCASPTTSIRAARFTRVLRSVFTLGKGFQLVWLVYWGFCCCCGSLPINI